MLFFIGWHQPVAGPSGAAGFSHCMISVNRLLNRRSAFPVQSWILDSGAFTRLSSGTGHLPVERYAAEVQRWAGNGNLLATVSQDFMCEPCILAKTGCTVVQHQRLTLERYDALQSLLDPAKDPYVMPVLQGYTAAQYLAHLDAYGDRLRPGQWVGVGSVCKRNAAPSQIEALLLALKTARPDLRLHGFGLKKTALESTLVWDLLYSSDSQAHSYHARRNGLPRNNPATAQTYSDKIRPPAQLSVFSAQR